MQLVLQGSLYVEALEVVLTVLWLLWHGRLYSIEWVVAVDHEVV